MMNERDKNASALTDRLQPPQLASSDLFRHGNTVCIEHHGQQYWLRLTRANKLILTK